MGTEVCETPRNKSNYNPRVASLPHAIGEIAERGGFAPRAVCRECSQPALRGSVHCIDHHTIPLEHKRGPEYADHHSEKNLPHAVRYTMPMAYKFKSAALQKQHDDHIADPNLFSLREEMALMKMCVQAVLSKIPEDMSQLPDAQVPVLVALLSEASRMIGVAVKTEELLKATYNIEQIHQAVEEVAVATLPFIPHERRAEFLTNLQNMPVLTVPGDKRSTREVHVTQLKSQFQLLDESKLKDVDATDVTQNVDEGLNLSDEELRELAAASEEVRKSAPARIA